MGVGDVDYCCDKPITKGGNSEQNSGNSVLPRQFVVTPNVIDRILLSTLLGPALPQENSPMFPYYYVIPARAGTQVIHG